MNCTRSPCEPIEEFSGKGLVPFSLPSHPDNWCDTSTTSSVLGWGLCQLSSNSGVEQNYWWVAEMQAHLLVLGKKWWKRRSRHNLGPRKNHFHVFLSFLRENIASTSSGLIALCHMRASLSCRHPWFALIPAGRQAKYSSTNRAASDWGVSCVCLRAEWFMGHLTCCSSVFSLVWQPKDCYHFSRFSCQTLLAVSLASLREYLRRARFSGVLCRQ